MMADSKLPPVLNPALPFVAVGEEVKSAISLIEAFESPLAYRGGLFNPVS